MTLSPVPGNAPTKPTFVVVDPTHFDVSYAINPWMRPEDWKADPERFRQASRLASANLVAALETAGARVEILPGVAGVPDLVFPANAAVVFEGKAVLGRFRHPERRAEEAINLAAFEGLKSRGLLCEVVQLPTGVFHEGAGDFMWDASRGLFWSGYGQRSDLAGASAIAAPRMSITAPATPSPGSAMLVHAARAKTSRASAASPASISPGRTGAVAARTTVSSRPNMVMTSFPSAGTGPAPLRRARVAVRRRGRRSTKPPAGCGRSRAW